MRNWSDSFVRSFAKLNSVLDKPFYARDLGLNGGSIGALACYRVIKWTGNEKEFSAPYPNPDSPLLSYTAKEWVVRKDKYERLRASIKADIVEMKNTIALCESLGL